MVVVKVGRKSKLTPELQKKLINAIKQGNYYEAACAYVGIDRSTFFLWMKKGEQAKSGKYFELFNAVKQAEAEAEARIVANWQSKVPEDWRAAQAFLEKRFPDRWGKKETHVLEGGEEPIKVENNLEEILAKYKETVEAIHRERLGSFSEDDYSE